MEAKEILESDLESNQEEDQQNYDFVLSLVGELDLNV